MPDTRVVSGALHAAKRLPVPVSIEQACNSAEAISEACPNLPGPDPSPSQCAMRNYRAWLRTLIAFSPNAA